MDAIYSYNSYSYVCSHIHSDTYTHTHTHTQTIHTHTYAHTGFISGVHLWLVKVNSLSEPDSIFIGVCRGCMPLDQDPQDLRDRTYYLRY
jgi:hypothetical protein